MESSPDDIGNDPGNEMFHEDDDDNDGGPSGAGPSGDDEHSVDENPPAEVLSNRTMLRKLVFCFYFGFYAGKLLVWVINQNKLSSPGPSPSPGPCPNRPPS